MNFKMTEAQAAYQAPEICVMETLTEGVICDSANGTIDPWGNDDDFLGAPAIF